ncbi:MAG: AAA family ATPase [Clostridia bacterium]|nr:AAA family ATPase [Clostridia bacterium]
MKPIRLEMTAFGPYRDKVEVDFDKLGSGLYLITGDTGAGKTTIFDGIMYALFEEVSAMPAGSAADASATRDKKKVHSDYAPKSTPTTVRLEFEEKGKRYTVTRTIRFAKKRDGSGFNPAAFDA